MVIKICPFHHVPLVSAKTKYGFRFDCPVCDVYCWDGPTSTPALPSTHRARKEAHKVFDRLWSPSTIVFKQPDHGFIGNMVKFTRRERNRLYKLLAEHMGLPREKTHIGMFDDMQCKQVIEFAKTINTKGRK